MKEFLDKQQFIKRRNRDTAWFSVIDKEWKKYKKSVTLNTLKRSNFNSKLIQKKKLKLI